MMEGAETIPRHEAIGSDDCVVRDWRIAQLKRLEIPEPVAHAAAAHVDWHDIARLVQRGCPPLLGLRIVR
jgi:hypothetical protein